MPTIRELSEADIATMRELLDVFGQAFDEIDTYTSQQPSDTYLRDRLKCDVFIALAAVEDNAVIGGLAAYELKKFESQRSEIYIYDIAVAEQHRRRGIATQLIEKLKIIASRRGAYVIFVQADYSDPPAIALYSKLGTREDVFHFDIDVR